MLDTSHLPFEENVALTRKVVDAAHALDVDVEAELGHLPLGSGDEDQATPFSTDPEQAVDFVERTKVDVLAVSIGNIHVLLQGKSNQLDFGRLERIHRMVQLPLVIHGSTGFPDEAVSRVIDLGVAKFNVGTVLKRAFLQGLREALSNTPKDANPQHVMGSRRKDDVLVHAREGMRREVERLIGLYVKSKSA
jgi:ketose-bisphosphate aldolase